MKILFTVGTYLPHIDGIQFVTTYLAEGLVKNGHSVDVITYSRPEIDCMSSNCINGVNIIRWNAKTKHLRHRGDKKEYQEFILNHQHEYDAIVNVGTQTAFTDWQFPIMKDIHVPLVLHMHSMWDFRFYPNDKESLRSLAIKIISNLRWGVYYLLNGKNFRRYKSIIQLHEKDHGVEFFKKHYHIDCDILGNAVDEQFFKETDVQYTGKPYIVNVANFNKMKNQKKSVEVFLNADLPDDWSLYLVGSKENDYCKELKKYAEDLQEKYKKNNKINICIGLDRKEIYDIVKNSSLFMTTSLREAFPICIIEAMAAGVPYLSTDVGIVKYLPGGIIADSEIDMVEKLRQFALFDDLRMEYGKKGHEYAQRNNLKSCKVAELERLLQSIICNK